MPSTEKSRTQPYFVGPRLSLRLVAHELLADDVILLTYVPA